VKIPSPASAYIKPTEKSGYPLLTGQQSTSWIALDDSADAFQDMSNLVHCSAEKGFDDIAAKRLRNELMVKSSLPPRS